jgi:hypothetical protein
MEKYWVGLWREKLVTGKLNLKYNGVCRKSI